MYLHQDVGLMAIYFILWAVIQYSIYFCCSNYSRLGHRELSHVGLCAPVIRPVLSWALHSLVTQNAPGLHCIFSACVLESTPSSEFWQMWKSSFKLSLETIGIIPLDDITYRGLIWLFAMWHKNLIPFRPRNISRNPCSKCDYGHFANEKTKKAKKKSK